jgi:subtilisin family serine protease
MRKQMVDNLRSVGIATVAASQNNSFTDKIAAPACISSAVSVGSATKTDQVSPASNSAPFLSLLAPGIPITSSVPGGGFGIMGNTSMATPHVAGAWAILKQQFPTATVGAVLNALRVTGLPITDAKNGVTTPRIRIAEAFTAPIVTRFEGDADEVGSASAKVAIQGAFAFGGPLGDLRSSALTIPTLLDESATGGAGELAAGVPITLSPGRGGNPDEVIFRTADRLRPKVWMELKRVSEGRFTFRLVVEFTTIDIPSLCTPGAPTTILGTGFAIDDGMNPPVVVATAEPWQCRLGAHARELIARPR